MKDPSPRIEIQPACALVDERITIRLTGFAAAQHVTLRARMADYSGGAWESHATFVADTQGCVDVSTQRPVSGTYEQVDPMGLFWSMAPPAEVQGSPVPVLVPRRVQFDVAVDRVVAASAEAERRFVAPGVTGTEVRDNGLVATLFRALGSGSSPAIVVLGGSEGGLWEAPAALLASHGFVTLALAYFGVESLPPCLAEIPLEYFGTAIRWLQQQHGVRPQSLAVLGRSRGGELALLLGATFPEIRAVIAYVPSGLLWTGAAYVADEVVEFVAKRIDTNMMEGVLTRIVAYASRMRSPITVELATEVLRDLQVAATEQPAPLAAWTYNGQPLPSIRPVSAAIVWNNPPIASTPSFVAALQDEEAVAQATIPVERTRGPVLMISGEDDQVCPSPRLAEIVVQRLKRHNFAFPVEHLSYPHAGHLLGPPYVPTTLRHSRHPVTKVDFAYGGTALGDAFARADSWPKVLAFLREHLGGCSVV